MKCIRHQGLGTITVSRQIAVTGPGYGLKGRLRHIEKCFHDPIDFLVFAVERDDTLVKFEHFVKANLSLKCPVRQCFFNVPSG